MKLSSDFQSRLENPNVTFTTEELEDGLRLMMIDFIEERVELYRLLEVSERLRRDFLHHLSKRFFEVIDILHNFHEDLHKSEHKKLTDEEFVYVVDDLLCKLT